MRKTDLAVVLLLLIGACNGPEGEKAQAPDNAQSNAQSSALTYMKSVPADQLPGDAVKLPMKEFMGHVMQYGGDGIWKRQGYVVDESGEKSLFPTTDEEWEEAESGALTLAELSNLLLLPGRRVDDPRWDKSVAEVRAVAQRAAKAAEGKDEAMFFEAGGALDNACESCHLNFAPWSAKPHTLQAAGRSPGSAPPE